MTKAVVAQTKSTDSCRAGTCLGQQITETLTEPPDVVILFASPTYCHTELLSSLKATCHPKILIGCSSAGEFTDTIYGEGLACAVAIYAPEMQFAAGIGYRLSENQVDAAKDALASFHGLSNSEYKYRTTLILADALAGYTDNFVRLLTFLTAGKYQFFGGGAGDNAQFRSTPVFYGTEVISDAAVTLEILSNKPLGIGVSHGWRPASKGWRATKVRGKNLVHLNDRPAVEVLQEYAQATGQIFDLNEPMPFLLYNVLGIDTNIGYKLRVPLAVNPDGSILCAAEIPADSMVHLMTSTSTSPTEAAVRAVKAARQQLFGARPALTFFFDCVATRLKMGSDFKLELDAVRDALGASPYIGCNSHGQIARVAGQFSDFHNCTAVICIIPE